MRRRAPATRGGMAAHEDEDDGEVRDAGAAAAASTSLLPRVQCRAGPGPGTAAAAAAVRTRAARLVALHFLVPAALYALLLLAAEADRARRPDARTSPTALRWFDSSFRRLGSVYPFAVLPLHALGARARAGAPPLRARAMLALFVPLTALRLAAYLLLQSAAAPIMSDHVFLAMSVSAMLQTILLAEAAADADKGDAEEGGGVCSVVSRLMSVVIVILLMANSYVTFRFHHTLRENLLAVLAGAAAFQLPAAAWAWRELRVAASMTAVDCASERVSE